MTNRRLLMILAPVAFLGAGYLVFAAAFLNRGLPDGLIQANGRIEGDHVTVGSKFPGRIEELLVREGHNVAKGQVMIRLDDVQTRSKVDQARHAWDTTEAQ